MSRLISPVPKHKLSSKPGTPLSPEINIEVKYAKTPLKRQQFPTPAQVNYQESNTHCQKILDQYGNNKDGILPQLTPLKTIPRASSIPRQH